MSQYIERLISGALFDFAGFLTTLDKPVTFSACHEATSAVELLSAWAAKRGLALDEARVKDWTATLKAAQGGVTEAMVERALRAFNESRNYFGNVAHVAMRAALEAALSAQAERVPEVNWLADQLCDLRNKWAEGCEANWLETDDNHPDDWMAKELRKRWIAASPAPSPARVDGGEG